MNGDGLASVDSAFLYVTAAGAPPGTAFNGDRTIFRTFVVDRSETTRYREQLRSEDDLEPATVANHCCYSGCAALVVGKPTTTHERLPLATPEVCIPRPPAGTNVPAAGDRACPAGVELDGNLRAYVGTTDERCCYDMRS
jgi:hypothetical protein